jgi:hypothetical protein
MEFQTTPRAGSFRGDIRRLSRVGGGTGTVPADPHQPTGVTPAGGPVVGVSFPGLDHENWGSGYPPDTTGDVGPSHYIQAVNTSVGIFNKTGTLLAAFTYNALFDAAATGTLCDSQNRSNPLVVYDQMADRWIVADLAYLGNGTSPPFFHCVAVSKTGDPISGGWWLYALRSDTPPFTWYPDDQKAGIWPDGLYISANMLDSSFSLRGVRIGAYNRSDLYGGSPVRAVVYRIVGQAQSILPSNVRGAAPPAGRPNLLVMESLSTPQFQIYRFQPDYSDPASSTFTGPTTVVHAPHALPDPTVPTPGTALNTSLGERLMQWAQYRNIGGVESLWVSHTVRVPSSNLTGIQWAQIDVSGGTINPIPLQQAFYDNGGADGVHRWVGSLAVNKDSDMALGYSASSATVEPDIRVNGRLSTDTVNTVTQGETSLLSGARGHQDGNPRWGYNSSMSVDPDGCTFWYSNEYYETTGLNWQTRIGSLSFGTCTPLVQPGISVDDSTAPEGTGGTTTRTFTVSLSAASLNGAHVDFATTDGSATTADTDYVARSGTLQFDAGETTKTIDVTVNADSVFEPDETFTLDLSNAIGATIADAQGAGTLGNDDASPPPPPPPPPPTPWPFVWASTTHAPPDTNRRVAGEVVGVKFTIGGYQGLDVFAPGWPKSKHYRCSTGELLARGRTRTQPLGNAGLSYDTVSGVYTYRWQTLASWAGTCRQFQVTLTDGTFYSAKFTFRAPSAAASSGAVELVRRR